MSVVAQHCCGLYIQQMHFRGVNTCYPQLLAYRPARCCPFFALSCINARKACTVYLYSWLVCAGALHMCRPTEQPAHTADPKQSPAALPDGSSRRLARVLAAQLI